MVSAMAEIYSGCSAFGIIGAWYSYHGRFFEYQPAQQKPAGCSSVHFYRIQDEEPVYNGSVWNYTDVTVESFTLVISGGVFFGKRLQCL
jgi:hypothetical protein